MLLVLVGGVMSANADDNMITVYFQITNSDDGWKNDGARFAMCLQDANNSNDQWVSFTSANITGYSDLYVASFTPNSIYTKLIICRMNGSVETNSWSNKYNQSGNLLVPTNDCYFAKTAKAEGSNNWNDWTYSPSLLPWCYYFYGSWANENNNDSWKVGDALTESEGSYSGDLKDKAGRNFVIITGNHIQSTGYLWNDDSWNNAIRPSESLTIDFDNYLSKSTTTGGMNNWWIKSSNTGDVHFTYTPGTNATTSITCSKTVTINAAESNGKYYATFSSNYNVAIPDGVIAYYASTAGNGSVTMTPFENGIASAQGAFLKLPKASDNYTFTPASSTDNITTNYLAKGTSDGVSSSTSGYNYVFARQQGVVGFYKVGTTATGSLEGKAYLHSETSLTTTTAPYLSIELDGETTDIKVIDVDFMQPASNNGATYDLSGRRVENMTKGVYIVNGKKVIVK